MSHLVHASTGEPITWSDAFAALVPYNFQPFDVLGVGYTLSLLSPNSVVRVHLSPEAFVKFFREQTRTPDLLRLDRDSHWWRVVVKGLEFGSLISDSEAVELGILLPEQVNA